MAKKRLHVSEVFSPMENLNSATSKSNSNVGAGIEAGQTVNHRRIEREIASQHTKSRHFLHLLWSEGGGDLDVKKGISTDVLMF